MGVSHSILTAARSLKCGGVIAYPTDTVFGLGCLPTDSAAIRRILLIKHRGAGKGLILLGANRTQFEPYVSAKLSQSDWNTITAARPVPTTWLVPASSTASPLLRGDHPTIAIRITRHTLSRALCTAAQSAIVSTSANVSGDTPPRLWTALSQEITRGVDLILANTSEGAAQASQIRELSSKRLIRL